MTFSWTHTRTSPIAVDFGADSLKLLQIVPSDPPQMAAAARMDVPEHARTDPGARHAFHAEALKTLLSMQPFKGRQAVCSIPAYQTLVQHLQIAKVEHEDLDAQIALHLRQRLNVDPARLVMRCVQVGPIVRDGSPKQEVICLAASRDAVMRYIDICSKCRLDVVGMHCEPLAILKAFGHLYRRADDGQRTTCFIDLGATTTKVIVAHGAEMVFAKVIGVGGDQLTRHWATSHGKTFAEAREARFAEIGAATPAASEAVAIAATSRRTPAAPVGGALAILDAQLAAQQAAEGPATPRADDHRNPAKAGAVADALDCLIDELHLCLRYHQSMFPGRSVEKLVFVGGESRHVEICQKIARSLRIGAQLGDPLARLVRAGVAKPPVGVDMRQPQPGWAVPIGLCLCQAQ